jgi:membrane-associated phospholipid phosphatase
MNNANKRFWKGVAVVSVELVGAMAVFAAVLAGIVFLIRPWVQQYKILDLEVFDHIAPYVNHLNTDFFYAVTQLAQQWFMIPLNFLLIAYFLFLRHKSWFSIRIAAISLSSLLLMFALKFLFMRERPDDPLLFKADGYSFPSGHAVMSTCFYGLLIYITHKTIKNPWFRWLITFVFIAVILLIGISRVYLRVHYASDVLVGYFVGVLWLLISLFLLKRIEDYNKSKIGEVKEVTPE